MPRSPLAILLLVLTLLVFAGHLASLEDAGWSPPLYLGAGVILAISSTVLVVRDGAAFDDRAFHRTRPRGDFRAFRNATLTLLGMVAAVSAMSAGWGLFFNLDGSYALRFALATALPLLLCIAACATGFTLISSGESRPLRMAALLAVPPLAVDLWIRERSPARFESPYYSYNEFFFSLTWVAVAGLTGYALAWWLAAARKRRHAALVLACLTGALLPLAKFLGPLPYPELPVLPEAALTIMRTPLTDNPEERKLQDQSRDRHASMLRSTKHPEQAHYLEIPLLLDRRFHLSGLREDEFISATVFVPHAYPPQRRAPDAHPTSRRESRTAGQQSTFSVRGDSVLTGQTPVLRLLTSRLPSPSTLEPRRGGLAVGDILQLDGDRTTSATVEALDWQLRGLVLRLEDAGNFDLARGGRQRLPSGGSVRVDAYQAAASPGTLRLSLTDSWRFDLSRHYDIWSSATFPHTPLALLRDPETGLVRVPRVSYGTATQYRSVSYQVDLNQLDDWSDPETAAAILRSRLYLFRALPVSQFSLALPPAR